MECGTAVEHALQQRHNPVALQLGERVGQRLAEPDLPPVKPFHTGRVDQLHHKVGAAQHHHAAGGLHEHPSERFALAGGGRQIAAQLKFGGGGQCKCLEHPFVTRCPLAWLRVDCADRAEHAPVAVAQGVAGPRDNPQQRDRRSVARTGITPDVTEDKRLV